MSKKQAKKRKRRLEASKTSEYIERMSQHYDPLQVILERIDQRIQRSIRIQERVRRHCSDSLAAARERVALRRAGWLREE